MPLQPGTRLGPYEIAAQIGVGGMGEVYQATDTKLKRQVAIKVLPESVAADAERLARFQREAEVLASLNHPHIAGIYGLEEADGVKALVMELVEGPTLADRIAEGAIPIDEALAIAKQIAEALEAAHEQGIIHRDLKPANVKVRDDGTVKVLDFGLAKAMAPAGAMSASASMSPTITTPAMTEMGMILGTAAYMAPEQAKGKTVDKRADVWAFGVVLYEMLTGRGLFQADTLVETLAQVMTRELPSEALPDVPASIHALLERCLERDPRRRLRDIGEARIILELPLTAAPTDATSVATSAWSMAQLVAVALALVSALLLGAAAGWWLRVGTPVTTDPVRRLSMVSDSLATSRATAFTRRHVLDISADGLAIAFVGDDGAYLRRLDQPAAVPVPGTEGAGSLAFRPDGEWLAFGVEGSLRKISLQGGNPVEVASLGDQDQSVSSICWSPDGTLFFTANFDGYSALYRVPDQGGEPQFVVDRNLPNGVRREIGSPQLIDGGRKLLFSETPGDVVPSARNSRIILLDLESMSETVVAEQAGFARYVPSGHLLTVLQNDRLQVAPFDLRRARTTGPAVPLPSELLGYETGMFADLAFSDEGTMAHVSGASASPTRDFVWLGFDGQETPQSTESQPFVTAELSPDSRQAAVTIGGDKSGLFVYDVDRDSLRALTFDEHEYFAPVWTPDGDLIYLRSVAGEEPLVWRWDIDSGDDPRLLLEPKTIWYVPQSVSPDGATLAAFIWDLETDRHWDIQLVSLGGDPEPRRFAASPRDELFPRFSPDGNWIAYQTGSESSGEIHVKAFPERGAPIQVSVDGGTRPFWGPDGRSLLFLTTDSSAVMRVGITWGDSPQFGAPEQVVELPPSLRPESWYPWGGLAGDRLFLVQTNDLPSGRIDVVLNWFEELKRLVPVR